MKILFFTPTGARTGSEMMLWYLLKHLSETSIKTAIYARQAGELFSKHSPAHETFINAFHKGLPYHVVEAVYNTAFGLTPEESYIKYIHRKSKPDVWYFNTITMPQFARLAHQLKVPYIVHAHELPSIYDTLRADAFGFMLENAAMSIGCSQVVVEELQKMGVSNVQLFHEFIDTEKIKINTPPSALRQQLGIPPEAFVWLMSGTMCTRKGYDFVPDLLRHLPSNAYIVWLGSKSEYGLSYYIQQRVRLENLNFIALGSKGEQDYYDYLNLCDGFVLTSREDPFPLVMIEAAYLQKPVVGFDSGGISEFVLPGMGGVAPAFDIGALAHLMRQIMDKQMTISPQILRDRAATFDVKRQLDNWKALLSHL
ncbi:MAG: glycosyltransferase family 4 protein [Runella sp.]